MIDERKRWWGKGGKSGTNREYPIKIYGWFSIANTGKGQFWKIETMHGGGLIIGVMWRNLKGSDMRFDSIES